MPLAETQMDLKIHIKCNKSDKKKSYDHLYVEAKK